MKNIAICLLVGVGALPLFARIELATPFTDGAVLQCDRAVPIWGQASPSKEVVVSFADARVETTAAKDGS